MDPVDYCYDHISDILIAGREGSGWANKCKLAKGYNYTTGGLTVGIDYHVTDHFVLGLMGGYAHSWTV
jgi:outer membrane autotransporter protein